jgi:hypothetical protein
LTPRKAELNIFDIIEGLVIRGAPESKSSMGSGSTGFGPSCPRPAVTAKIAVEMIVEHWSESGLPTYAQFDNDTVFSRRPSMP